MGFFLAFGHLYKKGAFKPSLAKLTGSFIIFVILLSLGIFELSLELGNMMHGVTLSNTLNVGAYGAATGFAAFGTMKSSNFAHLSMEQPKPVKGIQISQKTVNVLVAILFIIAAEILWLMIQVDPTNLVQEAGFGMGLGGLLFIVGIGIRLYRLAYYNE